MRRTAVTLLPWTLGVVVALLFFGHLLRPATVLVARDLPRFHLPLRTDLAVLARHGLPEWNPFVHGGQPILSNPNYAAFYPPTWLLLLIEPAAALRLLVLLHALWAFVGSWRLARHLGTGRPAAALAGLAFVGGGAFLSSPATFNLYCGLAWLPWVLRWGEGALRGGSEEPWLGGAALTALGLAAQLLAGEPLMPLASAVALLCLAPWHPPAALRRGGVRLLAIGLLAATLGAVQLLPTIAHLRQSPRAAGVGEGRALAWSTPPERLAEWLWPHLHGDPARSGEGLYFGFAGSDLPRSYIDSIHCGRLVALLALAALLATPVPRRGAWIAMVAVGVLLALGRHDPLYAHLLVRLPPFSLVRYPEKLIVLATTGLVFAAALGWDRLLAARRDGERQAALPAVALALLALAACLALVLLPIVAPGLASRLVRGAASAPLPPSLLAARLAWLGREALLSTAAVAAALGVLLLHRGRRPVQAVLVAGVLLLTAADLAWYGRDLNPVAPAAALLTPPPGLQADAGGQRLFSDRLLFGSREPLAQADPASPLPADLRTAVARGDPYLANLWGWSYALDPDYDLMLTRWARHALTVLVEQTGLAEAGWGATPLRYLGAWNVGLLARRRAPAELERERRLTGAWAPPARLVPNPYRLPRYRLVARVRYEPDLAAAVAAARGSGFDLGTTDYVWRRAGASRGGAEERELAGGGRLLGWRESGARIEVDYDCLAPCFLVAAVTFDEGWRADAGGAAVGLAPTAIGQIGVELPAGRRRLTLRYHTPWLRPGAALSVAALAGCLLLVARRRIRLWR